MKKNKKVWKYNIFGYKLFIRITYPTKRKYYNLTFLSFGKYTYVLIAVVMISGFFIQNYFENSTYATKNIKLTQENHPKDKIIFNGSRSVKKIALTFDADMTLQMKQDLELGNVESYFDKDLIEALIQTETKATLFLSGMWIEFYREEAVNLSNNLLFELGNHTYSHLAFESACYGLGLAGKDQKMDELIKTQKLLKELSGTDNKLFRFPGGCYSETDLGLVFKTGQVAVQWDVAAQDGFNTDASNIINNVVENVKNGSIVVMHMNGYPNEPMTANVLPVIISKLKEKGFEFVTVSELLDFKTERIVKAKNLFGLVVD